MKIRSLFEEKVTNIADARQQREDLKLSQEMNKMRSQIKKIETMQNTLDHNIAAAIDGLIQAGFSENAAQQHVITYLNNIVITYDLER